MKLEHIRNFSIIAHIDHGKSTLADRLLEFTGTLSARERTDQFLDSMDLEKERGITIKASPVRLLYRAKNGVEYALNLIDTPGHVDFTYEVSRSLAACEGALLVVDAVQGVEAQTVANVHLALDHHLFILPVINKIDLPSADPARVKKEIEEVIGLDASEAILASAKEGIGTEEILEGIVNSFPPPQGKPEDPLRALIFDSWFDPYHGAVVMIRIFDGVVRKGMRIRMMSTGEVFEVTRLGIFSPGPLEVAELMAGDVGFLMAGIKAIGDTRIGDTMTTEQGPATQALPGFKAMKPTVFSGLYPADAGQYQSLREALEKLSLNDSSFTFEPETSQALGFGFRCGFLGLLHLEVIQERLQREYNLELVVTVPSVAYNVQTTDGQNVTVRSPHELPRSEMIVQVTEPVMRLDIFTPKQYVGPVMQLVSERRAVYKTTEYLDERIAVLHYDVPLTALLVDFYDRIKSASSGYASINYELLEYRPTDIVRLDILVADESVEALASLVYRDSTFRVGKEIVSTLKETMPRQQFMLKLQAAVGGKIIAAERLSALRKDVTENLYGGDYTRKRKVLEKQKRGKKRMLSHGRVDIPPEAFLAVLKREKN